MLPRLGTACLQRIRSFSTSSAKGFIEVREYTLKPESIQEFFALSESNAELRKQLLPFLGMFTCDLGGPLNRVLHMYGYKDFDERDAVRAKAASHPDWAKYVRHARTFVNKQESRILLEAFPLYEAIGKKSAMQYISPPPKPGQKVPLNACRNVQNKPLLTIDLTLPGKIAVDNEGELVCLGYTDVGILNTVMELWRYPTAQACVRFDSLNLLQQSNNTSFSFDINDDAWTKGSLHFVTTDSFQAQPQGSTQ